LDTFQWFSQVGDWERIFPWYQRWIIVYVGAIVMRAVAGRLKSKYNLHDDVRLSLYECAQRWVKAVGQKSFLGRNSLSMFDTDRSIRPRPFLVSGGSEPNLADLNVYGILTAIQGCQAFDDLMKNTDIQPWFERMKSIVEPQGQHST
jgi:microsomal prostaglandin-E synthase 2